MLETALLRSPNLRSRLVQTVVVDDQTAGRDMMGCAICFATSRASSATPGAVGRKRCRRMRPSLPCGLPVATRSPHRKRCVGRCKTCWSSAIARWSRQISAPRRRAERPLGPGLWAVAPPGGQRPAAPFL